MTSHTPTKFIKIGQTKQNGLKSNLPGLDGHALPVTQDPYVPVMSRLKIRLAPTTRHKRATVTHVLNLREESLFLSDRILTLIWCLKKDTRVREEKDSPL